MASALDGHLREEVLEKYAMGQLTGTELESSEEHLLICEFCRQRLVRMDAFLIAVREAAATLLDSIGFVHQTPDGPVRLMLVRTKLGRWAGRLRGPELDAAQVHDRPEAAWAGIRALFKELFPDHECNPRCGPE